MQRASLYEIVLVSVYVCVFLCFLVHISSKKFFIDFTDTCHVGT